MSKTEDAASRAYKAVASPNLLINGDFAVAQRGTALSFTASDTGYVADRWLCSNASSGEFGLNQLSYTGSAQEFEHYLYLNVSTADASLTAAQRVHITQKIEGYNVRNLALGKSNAKTVTLSFWHKHHKAGINCVSFRSESAGRSYVVEYTQDTADAWEFEEITVPLDTGGTWLSTLNGWGIAVDFAVATGSNYQTTAETWASGDYMSTSNQVNNMDSTDNYFSLAGVKLEVGDYATPWAHRSFADELALCQRYYEKSYEYSVAPGTVTATGAWDITGQKAVQTQYIGSPFQVPKRDAPTMSGWGTDGTADRIQGTDSANLTLSGFTVSSRQIQGITATASFVLHDRYRIHWEA
jgi:hypothetical protein